MSEGWTDAPDEFEQALLADIAEADLVSDEAVASDLRIQLEAYRRARQTAIEKTGGAGGELT